MERLERRQNHIEYLLDNCSYFATMVEIGKIVSRYGAPPEQFPVKSIRTLDAGIYHVDIFLSAVNYSTIALSKKDPNKKMLSPLQCSDIKLEVHSNGRMEALINIFTEPEIDQFQQPSGKDVKFNSDLMLYLQIKAAANRVCPKTLQYLNNVTNDALKTYKTLFPTTQLGDDYPPQGWNIQKT